MARDRFAVLRSRVAGLTTGLALAAVLVAACNGSGPPATPGATPGGATPVGPGGGTPAAPDSGVVAGRVTYANGQPLPGAMVFVYSSELRNSVDAQSGQDGTYRVQLGVPDANYDVVAWVDRDYNGGRYHVPLVPEGSTDTSFFGRDGRTQNFIWQMTGKAPWGAHLQPDNASHYIGGAIDVYVYDPNTDPSAANGIQAPAGATIEITLTPSGPLIDGSPGETLEHPVTLERETGPGHLSILSVGTILDVPVGRYDATARLIRPTESPVDLLAGYACVSTSGCPLRPETMGPTATIDFVPSTVQVLPYQMRPIAGVGLYLVEP